MTVGLSYNAAGQLATLTDSRDLTGANPSATTSYQYDSAGDVTQIQSQDGSGNVLADYQYTYGPSGATGSSGGTGQASSPSSTAVADLLFSETDNGVTTNYGYDASNELTSAGSTTESYDAAGNRTGAGYVYGPDNELLSDGTWNYSYDAVGNTVQKVNIATGETWTYGYDFNNRLTSAVDRQANGALIQQATYRYDVFGNLAEEDVTAADGTTTSTRYAYDRGKAWAALDGNNSDALETRYLSLGGPDQPAAQIGASGAVGWYLTDRLGSVRQVVNDAGTVLDQIAYDAFGAVTSETNPAQRGGFGFQGMGWDAAVGLYRTPRRDYDPTTGRWTTRDPSGFAAGDANLYRHELNNPLHYSDPSGEFVVLLVGILIGAVAVGYVLGPGAGVANAPTDPGDLRATRPWDSGDAASFFAGFIGGGLIGAATFPAADVGSGWVIQQLQTLWRVVAGGGAVATAAADNEEEIQEETERLVSTNLVNPSVPAPSVPPDSLFGRSFQDFGRDVIGWGSGPQAALDRIRTITLEQLTEQGVTPAQAQAARDFYAGVLARNPGNAAAAARVQLMDYILQLLGGQ